MSHREMEALEGNQLPRARELWGLNPGCQIPKPIMPPSQVSHLCF